MREAEPDALGNGVAGVGALLNATFVRTLACEFATLLFVRTIWKMFPLKEKSTVADIGEPSLSVPVPVKIASACAVPIPNKVTTVAAAPRCFKPFITHVSQKSAHQIPAEPTLGGQACANRYEQSTCQDDQQEVSASFQTVRLLADLSR